VIALVRLLLFNITTQPADSFHFQCKHSSGFVPVVFTEFLMFDDFLTPESAPISSPCIGVCTYHPTTGFCIGCGRTRQEITTWVEKSEDERLAIMAQLVARMGR
jgi:uncharacterized protein